MSNVIDPNSANERLDFVSEARKTHVMKDSKLAEKFAPVGKEISNFGDKIARIGSSQAVLNLTSTVVRATPYVLGSPTSSFVDAFRTRLDFLEMGAMAAVNTIIEFGLAIVSTLLATIAFGQSKTLNAAFKRNWVHTLMGANATTLGALGFVAPSLACAAYKFEARKTVESIRSDIINICKEARNSKLSDKELARGLLAYLKTTLADTAKGGVLLGKYVSSDMFKFFEDTANIRINSAFDDAKVELQAQHKAGLKGVHGKAKKALEKKQEAELKQLEKDREAALKKSSNLFSSLSKVINEDLDMDACAQIIDHITVVVDNEFIKAKPDRDAVEKAEKSTEALVGKIITDTMGAYNLEAAKTALEHVNNHPVEAKPVDAKLKGEKKEKAEAKAQRVAEKAQKAAVKLAEKNVTIATKQEELLGINAQMAIVLNTKAIAEKQLKKVSGSKKPEKKEQAAALKAEIKTLKGRVKELKAATKPLDKELKKLKGERSHDTMMGNIKEVLVEDVIAVGKAILGEAAFKTANKASEGFYNAWFGGHDAPPAPHSDDDGYDSN
jgi:hypothetical protein